MAVTKRLRFEVLRRDNFRCRYCGTGADAAELEADHVTPVALGGRDELDNLVTSCGPCNDGKATTAPDEAVTAALASTAPMAHEALELQRTVWGLLSDFTPRQLSEPASVDEAGLLTNVVGVWFSNWNSPSGPPTRPEPTGEQVAQFRATAVEAFRLGHSFPVLFTAAGAAGQDQAISINAQLRTLQAAVSAQLTALN